MKVRLRSFARIRELVGNDEKTLDVPQDATIEAVWALLSQSVPALCAMRSSLRFARNGSLVNADVALKEGDELALLPPSSGG